MGRRKITIQPLKNSRNRNTTFNKRKVGLMKKAIELSILCNSQVALMVFYDDKLHLYSSDDFPQMLRRYEEYEGEVEMLDNGHLPDLVPGKASSFKVGERKQKRSKRRRPVTATTPRSPSARRAPKARRVAVLRTPKTPITPQGPMPQMIPKMGGQNSQALPMRSFPAPRGTSTYQSAASAAAAAVASVSSGRQLRSRYQTQPEEASSSSSSSAAAAAAAASSSSSSSSSSPLALPQVPLTRKTSGSLVDKLKRKVSAPLQIPHPDHLSEIGNASHSDEPGSASSNATTQSSPPDLASLAQVSSRTPALMAGGGRGMRTPVLMTPAGLVPVADLAQYVQQGADGVPVMSVPASSSLQSPSAFFATSPTGPPGQQSSSSAPWAQQPANGSSSNASAEVVSNGAVQRQGNVVMLTPRTPRGGRRRIDTSQVFDLLVRASKHNTRS